MMKISVLGAGAWGTAVAAACADRHSTRLWARDPAQARAISERRENATYLAGIGLPNALSIGSDFEEARAHAGGGLFIVATPMNALQEMLERIGPAAAGVLWLCKGFERQGGRLGHEVARQLQSRGLAASRVGVLSGPSFAIEVARGQPSALVAASHDASLCEEAIAALHGDTLRIYSSDDPIGVEVGGAVKNVMAIATGISDHMPMSGSIGLGLNARAALITRGLAEMTRLGLALGARAETFMGLSGLGDLVLTATGDLSRNRTVGRLLAEGHSLDKILAELGHVAEGVLTTPMVLKRAAEAGVDMPIVGAVNEVLEGRITAPQALERLMGRQARAES